MRVTRAFTVTMLGMRGCSLHILCDLLPGWCVLEHQVAGDRLPGVRRRAGHAALELSALRR